MPTLFNFVAPKLKQKTAGEGQQRKKRRSNMDISNRHKPTNHKQSNGKPRSIPSEKSKHKNDVSLGAARRVPTKRPRQQGSPEPAGCEKSPRVCKKMAAKPAAVSLAESSHSAAGDPGATTAGHPSGAGSRPDCEPVNTASGASKTPFASTGRKQGDAFSHVVDGKSKHARGGGGAKSAATAS